jgi:hypothetical protein
MTDTSLDITTLTLSLAVAVVVAFLGYLLGERSARKAFRREKKYDAKFAAFREVLQACDAMIAFYTVITNASTLDFRTDVRDYLAKIGWPKDSLEATENQIVTAVSPYLVQLDLLDLGVELPRPVNAVDAQTGPNEPPRVEAPAPTGRIDDLGALILVLAPVGRRLAKSMTDLQLLGISEDLRKQLERFRRRVLNQGVAGGAKIAGLTPDKLLKLLDSWRSEREAVAEEMYYDLEATAL